MIETIETMHGPRRDRLSLPRPRLSEDTGMMQGRRFAFWWTAGTALLLAALLAVAYAWMHADPSRQSVSVVDALKLPVFAFAAATVVLSRPTPALVMLGLSLWRGRETRIAAPLPTGVEDEAAIAVQV